MLLPWLLVWLLSQHLARYRRETTAGTVLGYRTEGCLRGANRVCCPAALVLSGLRQLGVLSSHWQVLAVAGQGWGCLWAFIPCESGDSRFRSGRSSCRSRAVLVVPRVSPGRAWCSAPPWGCQGVPTCPAEVTAGTGWAQASSPQGDNPAWPLPFIPTGALDTHGEQAGLGAGLPCAVLF